MRDTFTRSTTWSVGLALAGVCVAAPAHAVPPAVATDQPATAAAAASPPAPPQPPPAPPPVAPPLAAPSPASSPAASPDWAPPGEGVKGGEGNLRDAPLLAPTGEARRFSLTWNPFTLFAVRAQLMFEATLADHHALNLSLFYASTRTNQVAASAADMTQADAVTTLFQGFGGELGYRWYSGTAGPRGFYVGPSFLLGHFDATPTRGYGTSSAMNGADVPYWNLGGAIDVGWQAIIADRFVAGLGGGLQYTVSTHSFPQQDLPASVYANNGLRPRILLGLGVAFD